MKLYEFFETAKNEKSTEEEFQELTKDAITAVYNCISNLEFTEDNKKEITDLLRNNPHKAEKCTFEFSRYNSVLYVAGESIVLNPLITFFSKEYETFSIETGFDFKIVIYPEIPWKIGIHFESNRNSIETRNFIISFHRDFAEKEKKTKILLEKEEKAKKVILPLLKKYSNDTYDGYFSPQCYFGVSLDNWKGF